MDKCSQSTKEMGTSIDAQQDPQDHSQLEPSQKNKKDDDIVDKKTDSESRSTSAEINNQVTSKEEDQMNDNLSPPSSKHLLPQADVVKRPLKKARTAYFIFASIKRPELLALHPGENVASIARRTGKLWSELTPDEKKKYQTMAAEERLLLGEQLKAQLEQEMKQKSSSNNNLGSSADFNSDTNTSSKVDSSSMSSTLNSTLPVTRIRKIIKLDPSVKGLSKEALYLITKCSELFTTALGKESVKIANMQNRRKLLPEDMAEVCSLKEQYFFLNEDIKDFMKQIVNERKEKKEIREKEGRKLSAEAEKAETTKTRTLGSFWNQPNI